MTSNKVINGAKVTCKITGFTGVVTGIVNKQEPKL